MSLEEKLKKLAEKKDAKAEWEAAKSKWIAVVKDLYEDIESWVQPWKDKGYLSVNRTLKSKSEEPVGDYEIDALEITVGDEAIVLEPFGMNVIGAIGRIDVYLRGFKSDAKLLLRLVNIEGEERWELWDGKFSGAARYPFDKIRLERLMDQWL